MTTSLHSTVSSHWMYDSPGVMPRSKIKYSSSDLPSSPYEDKLKGHTVVFKETSRGELKKVFEFPILLNRYLFRTNNDLFLKTVSSPVGYTHGAGLRPYGSEASKLVRLEKKGKKIFIDNQLVKYSDCRGHYLKLIV